MSRFCVGDRKCIVCRNMLNKSMMIRIARTKDNEIFVDISGKSCGRGAYICKNTECIDKAIKKRALDRSFKCKIDTSVYDELKGVLSGER